MGKAQSKRSVDITTETKKGDSDVTEKMEKIEDTDRREMNGDASLDSQIEEKSNDDAENDKDTATEKSDDLQAGGDSAEPCKSELLNSNKEEATICEEVSSPIDENKKSKKEKVKKKWSFRSISFGKKDKQKPLKNDDSPEATEAAVTNGVVEEKASQETDESQKKDTFNNGTPNETPLVMHQNGIATEHEKTERETENISPDVKNIEETADVINPTEEKNENKSNEIAENNTTQETDKTSNISTKPDVADIKNKSEENGVTDASKKENNVEEVSTVNLPTNDENRVEAKTENNDNTKLLKVESLTVNGNVDDVIHQNGSENKPQQDNEEAKAQIEEVNAKEHKEFAAVAEATQDPSITCE